MSAGSPFDVDGAMQVIEWFGGDGKKENRRGNTSGIPEFIARLDSQLETKQVLNNEILSVLKRSGICWCFYCSLLSAVSALSDKAKADRFRSQIFTLAIIDIKQGLPNEPSQQLLESLMANQHLLSIDTCKGLLERLLLTNFKPFKPTAECVRGLDRCLDLMSKIAQRPDTFIRLFVFSRLLDMAR